MNSDSDIIEHLPRHYSHTPYRNVHYPYAYRSYPYYYHHNSLPYYWWSWWYGYPYEDFNGQNDAATFQFNLSSVICLIIIILLCFSSLRS